MSVCVVWGEEIIFIAGVLRVSHSLSSKNRCRQIYAHGRSFAARDEKLNNKHLHREFWAAPEYEWCIPNDTHTQKRAHKVKLLFVSTQLYVLSARLHPRDSKAKRSFLKLMDSVIVIL